MATTYTPHTWTVGNQPTIQQFNEMEAGIAEAANNRLPLDGGQLTGAVQAASAPVASGAIRNIQAQSDDNIIPGTTALTTGAIILVYE